MRHEYTVTESGPFSGSVIVYDDEYDRIAPTKETSKYVFRLAQSIGRGKDESKVNGTDVVDLAVYRYPSETEAKRAKALATLAKLGLSPEDLVGDAK